jgi:hypothetical protein
MRFGSFLEGWNRSTVPQPIRFPCLPLVLCRHSSDFNRVTSTQELGLPTRARGVGSAPVLYPNKESPTPTIVLPEQPNRSILIRPPSNGESTTIDMCCSTLLPVGVVLSIDIQSLFYFSLQSVGIILSRKYPSSSEKRKGKNGYMTSFKHREEFWTNS